MRGAVPYTESVDSYIAVPEEAPPADSSRAPWGLLDMAKAIGIVISGTLISFLPVALLIYFIVGDNNAEDDPTALTLAIGSSAVLQILMAYSVYRFSIRKYRVSWSAVGLRWPQKATFWLPIPLVVGAYAIMLAYFGLLSAAGIHPDTDLPDGVFDNIGPAVALAVLSLLFAPVMEEIFFRGFVFGGLRGRWGTLWAALASGLLFGVVHTLNPGAFYIVPPIALVGALFALGYAYSGSIMGTIMAHFLFNLLSFLSGMFSS